MGNRYLIISGIEAGDGGTGKLIEYLESKNNGNYILLSIAEPNKEEIIKKIRELTGEKIVLIHPQTIGFELFIEIVQKNKVYWYVMDNSFFCVKSYNHLPYQFKACFDCINDSHDAAVFNACTPFPMKMDLKENLKYLKLIYDLKDRLVFLAQNQMQKKLLEWYFKSIKVSVIGLKTSDLLDEDIHFVPQEERVFDIVYHANPLEAKGLLVCLELSHYLAEYTFLIPSTFQECLCNLKTDFNKDEHDFPNVTFSKMGWHSGLGYYVKKAKVILVPSLWAAPIEGALLKSIRQNGKVAVCPTEFCFANEIPSGALIRLDACSMEKNATILRHVLKDTNKQKSLIINSHKWLNAYLSNDPIQAMDMKIASDIAPNPLGESIKNELIALHEENKKYRATFKQYNQNFTKEFIEFIKSFKKSKVAIFGAGGQGESVYNFIQEWNQYQHTNIEVKFFLDNSKHKWDTTYLDKKIVEPIYENVKTVENIIIASMWKDDIKIQLMEMGFNNTIVAVRFGYGY